MLIPTTIPQRIEIMKNHLGIVEDVEFGRLGGMSKSVVNQLQTGSIKSFAPRYAYKLEDKTGFSARWIMLGEGPTFVHNAREQVTATGTNNYTVQETRAEYAPDDLTEVLITYFKWMSEEHRTDLIATAEAWALRDNPTLLPIKWKPEAVQAQKKKLRRL
jgi:hypothetical protein